MPVQPVRLFGDPVLRTPAAAVTTFDAELRRLVADLTDTMHEERGVGLAAPQLGVGLRVFAYDCTWSTRPSSPSVTPSSSARRAACRSPSCPGTAAGT